MSAAASLGVDEMTQPRDLQAVAQERERAAADKILPLTSVDAAYLACAIDTDGGIYSQMRKDKRNGREWPQGSLYVCNTNDVLVKWAQRVTGVGSICAQRSRGASHYGKKPVYRWDVGTRQALFILRQIRPYIRLKELQADLLMELAALRLRSMRGRVSDPARQEQIVHDIQTANKMFGHTGCRALKSGATGC